MTTWERVAAVVDNPLIIKDGVSRMRTWRAPLVLTLYLGLLGIFGYAIFILLVLFMTSNGQVVAAQVGATVFTFLAFIQISLISLFAPALAAGSARTWCTGGSPRWASRAGNARPGGRCARRS